MYNAPPSTWVRGLDEGQSMCFDWAAMEAGLKVEASQREEDEAVNAARARRDKAMGRG